MRDAIRGPHVPTARPAGGPGAPGGPRPGDGVVELLRVVPRRAAGGGGPRLNLLLPTLDPGRTFGGARTALDLYATLGASFPRRRIVTFTALAEAGAAAVPDHRPVGPDDDPPDARQVVAAPRGVETSLAVGPDDVFLATFWTTAHLAIRLVAWQAAEYGRPVRPFAYLVQDFEPGFYPWSAQSELARATTAGEVPTIGIVNSSPLRDYLAGQGVRFAHEFTFEPRISPILRPLLDEPARPRERRIVVYGRPETPRNAFPLVVDGLREWVRTDPAAGAWTVVSAGRSHSPVDLGGGLALRSLGKLDLPAYGELLRTSAIGVSLMVSPHPSYPPLDMSHLGMLVLANRFADRDPSAWHENIRSLERFSAEGLAAGLAGLCRAFDADPTAGDRGRPLRGDYLAGGPPFPFAAELATLLGGVSASSGT